MAKIAVIAIACALGVCVGAAQADDEDLHLDYRGVPMWATKAELAKRFPLTCRPSQEAEADEVCTFKRTADESFGTARGTATQMLLLDGHLDSVRIWVPNRSMAFGDLVDGLNSKLGWADPYPGRRSWLQNGAEVFARTSHDGTFITYVSAEGASARDGRRERAGHRAAAGM